MTRKEADNILEYPVYKWSMDWDEREDGLNYTDAIEMAISALRAQQEAEKNEPLTLDELREMIEADNRVLDIVNSVPSVDAVPVVRCNDCIHRYGAPGQPNIQCAQMHDDDFCSYGERRDKSERPSIFRG